MVASARSKPDEDADDGDTGADGGTQRLDKWLWFVRVVKSRTLAAALVTEGKVRVNREKVTRPAQPLRAGDVVTITVRGHLRILKMVGPGVRRGPPIEAQTLYEDLTPPPPPRAQGDPPAGPGSGEREAGSGRPTKRDRRLFDKLRGER